jgi:hypothetical protein
LLGPKINSATARINRISGKPNFPGMSCLPWDTRGALGRRLSLASKFRLVTGGSQKTVVGPWSLVVDRQRLLAYREQAPDVGKWLDLPPDLRTENTRHFQWRDKPG